MAPSTADSIITLRSGGAVAEIHPAIGGRLGQVDFGSGPLLRGHAPDLGWAAWGCYPLLPWSNRIPGGLLRFADGEFQLPVNWEDGSAIHGLAASCPWDVVSVSATTAEL
jgi:aldose 1-epimerase